MRNYNQCRVNWNNHCRKFYNWQRKLSHCKELPNKRQLKLTGCKKTTNIDKDKSINLHNKSYLWNNLWNNSKKRLRIWMTLKVILITKIREESISELMKEKVLIKDQEDCLKRDSRMLKTCPICWYGNKNLPICNKPSKDFSNNSPQ